MNALKQLTRLVSLEASFSRLSISSRGFGQVVKNKKPPSPFLLFYRSKLSEIKELHKNSPNNVTRWSKTAGAMWKDLDDESKKYYKDVFLVQKQDYLAKVSEEELAERRSANIAHRAKNKKRREKAEARNLNKPKRPASAHGLFIREQVSLSHLSQSDMKPVFVKLNQDWKSLPESERSRLEEEARKHKDEFEKKLEAWEKEQIDNDRKHLVRLSTLKKMDLLEKKSKPKAKK